MKLNEACERFNQIAGIRFGKLFSADQLETIIRNKGKTGQLLELSLGMHLSNTNLDFEDGELKSNKCDASGKPKETVFITQISGIIEDLIQKRLFEDTHLYEKISNILYVPVCKDGDPADWMFLRSIHVNMDEERYSNLKEILHSDYYSICEQLKKHIETSPDGYIHTSSGQLIQIRSKDSKPYHPIFSSSYGRNISNKNHAFYFKKEFVYYIRKIDEE